MTRLGRLRHSEELKNSTSARRAQKNFAEEPGAQKSLWCADTGAQEPFAFARAWLAAQKVLTEEFGAQKPLRCADTGAQKPIAFGANHGPEAIVWAVRGRARRGRHTH
ncbi:hypothetical protein D5S17_09185 [Pseudonocardiaceae bacterium YIM PH 21723]|nr:hypothetical protein D5S17_09185 [Pseudonocardiaceae bacterium YIM PH 21723]